jgi:hypothetical protein
VNVVVLPFGKDLVGEDQKRQLVKRETRNYEWLRYVRTTLNYSGFTQAFCMFDADFRDTFYDESRSHANRTIIPKNVKTNKQNNLTVFTLLIWTRYHIVHVFSDLRITWKIQSMGLD